MYGKINEKGEFVCAPAIKKVINEENRTIIERYSKEELEAMGFKETLDIKGEGQPGPGMRPTFVCEDKGDHIVRITNWGSDKITIS